jgi:hypothetical protein
MSADYRAITPPIAGRSLRIVRLMAALLAAIFVCQLNASMLSHRPRAPAPLVCPSPLLEEA